MVNVLTVYCVNDTETETDDCMVIRSFPSAAIVLVEDLGDHAYINLNNNDGYFARIFLGEVNEKHHDKVRFNAKALSLWSETTGVYTNS